MIPHMVPGSALEGVLSNVVISCFTFEVKTKYI